MAPLTRWTCDICGTAITDPDVGLVVWPRSEARKFGGFKLVHKSISGRTCDPNDGPSMQISDLVGERGQAWLLYFLSEGPMSQQARLEAPHDEPTPQPRVSSLDEWVDLFRRLQVPWYEEARPLLNNELVRWSVSNYDDPGNYTPETLESVARAGG